MLLWYSHINPLAFTEVQNRIQRRHHDSHGLLDLFRKVSELKLFVSKTRATHTEFKTSGKAH
jgi:hypothetical protein